MRLYPRFWDEPKVELVVVGDKFAFVDLYSGVPELVGSPPPYFRGLARFSDIPRTDESGPAESRARPPRLAGTITWDCGIETPGTRAEPASSRSAGTGPLGP